MRKLNSVIWGIIIIIVGVIFFGNNLEFWNVDIFFDGWWTLFIIIPSIYCLFKKEWITSLLGLSIGVLLLLAAQDIIAWNMVGKSFIPIVLIIVGLSLIFKPHAKISTNKKGQAEYIGVFSANENKITKEFSGASAIAVFGGVDLDLRNAKIKEDIVIDCVSVFGGIDILLPDDISVKTSGVPIFGGIENKHLGKDNPTVYINYVCIFSSVEIK